MDATLEMLNQKEGQSSSMKGIDLTSAWPSEFDLSLYLLWDEEREIEKEKVSMTSIDGLTLLQVGATAIDWDGGLLSLE